MNLQSHHINQYYILTESHSRTLDNIAKLKNHLNNQESRAAQDVQMKARMDQFYKNRDKIKSGKISPKSG